MKRQLCPESVIYTAHHESMIMGMSSLIFSLPVLKLREGQAKK
jgi:hypothetical protein